MNTNENLTDENFTPASCQTNVSGSFYWKTDYYHHDNAFTMQDFIENHLPNGFEVIFDDGSYVEVKQNSTNTIFSLDAKGNGDSFNHVVNWHVLR